MYRAPKIESGSGVVRKLKDLPGKVFVATMEIPWGLLQEQMAWSPDHLHMVTDMDLDTVERLERIAPQFDVVVGVGGKLIETGLELADAQGVASFVVTHKKANVGFYERFGFVLVNEYQVSGGGPIAYSLRRLAKRTGSDGSED